MTTCIDVYKSKTLSDGSFDKLKLRIMVGQYQQKKDLVWDACSPTDSMRTFKYFLVDAVNNKKIVHQLDLIG